MSKIKTFDEVFANLTYYPRPVDGVDAELEIYFDEPVLTMDQAYDLRDALNNVISYHEKLEKGEGDD